MADRQPNIVIFMTDQEQADVSRPGSPCATPNLDRLAVTGVSFDRAYCPTAHCCPSRASFMTGLYPSQHGVYNNVSTNTAIRRGLNPGVETFSEVLRRAGYRLLYSGKWHVSDEEGPADRGWEELEVRSGRGASAHQRRWWTEPVDDTPAGARTWGTVRRPGWGDYRLFDSYPARDDTGSRESRDWPVVAAALRGLEELTASTQPWCLFVGPSGPHDPYVVPAPFADRYRADDVPLPESYHDPMLDKPGIYRRQRRLWDQLDEAEVRAAIAHYWAFCTLEDTYLGLLLDLLESKGQREDTLILRTSDHGDYAGAHGLFLKGVPAFREGSHVPCVISWPAGLGDQPRRVQAPVSLTDLAPTLLELAGLPAARLNADRGGPAGGRSLVPYLAGGGGPDEPTVAEEAAFGQFNGVELYYTQRVVRTRSFTYAYNGFDFDELYDLTTDPHELTNLADDPDYADVKHDLVRRMWEFATRTDDHIFSSYPTVALAPWGPAPTTP